LKRALLSLLRCPQCAGIFRLEESKGDEQEVEEGTLRCENCENENQIRNFVPRFIDGENYAAGFGFQWNRHAQTQLDKFNGTKITTERFFEGTQWKPDEVKGMNVLEAGCGAGRFTDVMLAAGMQVYSLDYSNAVDACLVNHGLHPNLNIVQGDMCKVPYAKQSFDRVFCFGVLQHTPDVRKSFFSLTELVRPGGSIAVDVYPNTLKARLHYPRYLLRPLAKRLAAPKLYSVVEKMVGFLLPISIGLKRIPLIGKYIYPLIPVANYWGDLPLDKKMLREWSVVDTFDWLASWYDQPQKAETIKSWMEEAGFVNIQVRNLGSFVATGDKPL